MRVRTERVGDGALGWEYRPCAVPGGWRADGLKLRVSAYPPSGCPRRPVGAFEVLRLGWVVHGDVSTVESSQDGPLLGMLRCHPLQPWL